MIRDTLYKVYMLRNPIDGSIFYVGRTQHGLKQRLQAHLSPSNKNPELKKTLKSILANGYYPEIILIAESTYLQLELDILAEYMKVHPLVNIQRKGMKSRNKVIAN